MPTPDVPLGPEALLADLTWLRALARHLVRDPHHADDVAQRTIVAALETPPTPDVPRRPWLAHVARNFARQLLRSERRRAQHESLWTPCGEASAPDTTVMRTDTVLAVVRAVHELEPLYRDVIVLRYLHDLETSEVALRLDVPVETVRTRLRRAIERLRARLDADHGGRRTTWAVALAPLVALRADAGANWISGGVTMAVTKKTLIAAVALGALIGGVTTGGVLNVLQSRAKSESARVPEPVGGANDSGALNGVASGAAASESTVRNGTDRPDAERGAGPTDWLDAIEVELPPPGTGVITGIVEAGDGTPVAGALVRATLPPPLRHWEPGAAPPPRPLLRSVEDAARDAKWRAGTTLETRTGADGAFTLQGVTDGEYSVRVWEPSFNFRAHRGTYAEAVRAGSHIRFDAELVVRMPVTVLFPDGTIPDSASVHWTHPTRGGGGGEWWFHEAPVVRVPPGEWTVSASVGREMRSEGTAVTVRSDSAPEPLTLALASRGRISGTLRLDPADAAWDDWVIRIRSVGESVKLRRDEDVARAPDRSFLFDDLPLGEYELTTGLVSEATLASRRVTVSSGIVNTELVVPRLTQTQVVELRVRGPDGPVGEGERINPSMALRTKFMASGMTTRTTRRSDGVYLMSIPTVEQMDAERKRHVEAFARVWREGAPAGLSPPPGPDPADFHWWVRVDWPGHGTREVEFAPGSTVRVDVAFD